MSCSERHNGREREPLRAITPLSRLAKRLGWTMSLVHLFLWHIIRFLCLLFYLIPIRRPRLDQIFAYKIYTQTEIQFKRYVRNCTPPSVPLDISLLYGIDI